MTTIHEPRATIAIGATLGGLALAPATAGVSMVIGNLVGAWCAGSMLGSIAAPQPGSSGRQDHGQSTRALGTSRPTSLESDRDTVILLTDASLFDIPSFVEDLDRMVEAGGQVVVSDVLVRAATHNRTALDWIEQSPVSVEVTTAGDLMSTCPIPLSDAVERSRRQLLSRLAPSHQVIAPTQEHLVQVESTDRIDWLKALEGSVQPHLQGLESTPVYVRSEKPYSS